MWRGWSIQSPHGRAMKKMEISYLWESVKIIIFIAKWPCKSELQNNVEKTFFPFVKFDDDYYSCIWHFVLRVYIKISITLPI